MPLPPKQRGKTRANLHKWLMQHPYLNPYNLIPSRKRFQLLTCLIRTLPDFIIIGAEKSGTTSLYNYLIQHPSIYPAFEKEPEFFDLNYHYGTCYYKSFFPNIFSKFFIKKALKKKFITCESTPTYIFNPHAPKRIKNLIPNAKFIIILRNPVDRAYSNYSQSFRREIENIPTFEDALKFDEERLKKELSLISDENYSSLKYNYFSYLDKGLYIKHIKNWLKYFPKEKFFITTLEDLENNPQEIIQSIFEFLELENYQIKDLQKLNMGKYSNMNLETRKRLAKYYKFYNEELCQFLNKKLDWN